MTERPAPPLAEQPARIINGRVWTEAEYEAFRAYQSDRAMLPGPGQDEEFEAHGRVSPVFRFKPRPLPYRRGR